MGKSRTIPLARGLVAGETDLIYGQLEVLLTDYKDVKVVIRRKPYSGRPDVKFSMSCTSLHSLVDILQEAQEKLDEIWLSEVATPEFARVTSKRNAR